MVEPIWRPSIGVVTIGTLLRVVPVRGLVGVTRDAVEGWAGIVIELGNGPMVHGMALNTRWPLIRGGVIFGRKVAFLAIGEPGVIECNFLPVHEGVTTGALPRVMVVRCIFPGVTGFAVGVEFLIDAYMIKIDDVPIGDVSVTIYARAQIELLGEKRLTLSRYAFSQPREMPAVEIRPGVPTWLSIRSPARQPRQVPRMLVGITLDHLIFQRPLQISGIAAVLCV